MPIVYHKLTQTESKRTVTKQNAACMVQTAPEKVLKMENEIDRKPGSVLNDDLSRPAIADRFVPPSGHASSAVRPI